MSDARCADAIEYLLGKLPDFVPYYEQTKADLYAEGNSRVVYGSIFTAYMNDFKKKRDDISIDGLSKCFVVIESLAALSEIA